MCTAPRLLPSVCLSPIRFNVDVDVNVNIPASFILSQLCCQHYIDPDAICCVVLDEAHHCGKEHPFNRVARSFLTMQAFPDEIANPRRASELPKVLFISVQAIQKEF